MAVTLLLLLNRLIAPETTEIDRNGGKGKSLSELGQIETIYAAVLIFWERSKESEMIANEAKIF